MRRAVVPDHAYTVTPPDASIFEALTAPLAGDYGSLHPAARRRVDMHDLRQGVAYMIAEDPRYRNVRKAFFRVGPGSAFNMTVPPDDMSTDHKKEVFFPMAAARLGLYVHDNYGGDAGRMLEDVERLARGVSMRTRLANGLRDLPGHGYRTRLWAYSRAASCVLNDEPIGLLPQQGSITTADMAMMMDGSSDAETAKSKVAYGLHATSGDHDPLVNWLLGEELIREALPVAETAAA